MTVMTRFGCVTPHISQSTTTLHSRAYCTRYQISLDLCSHSVLTIYDSLISWLFEQSLSSKRHWTYFLLTLCALLCSLNRFLGVLCLHVFPVAVWSSDIYNKTEGRSCDDKKNLGTTFSDVSECAAAALVDDECTGTELTHIMQTGDADAVMREVRTKTTTLAQTVDDLSSTRTIRGIGPMPMHSVLTLYVGALCLQSHCTFHSLHFAYALSTAPHWPPFPMTQRLNKSWKWCWTPTVEREHRERRIRGLDSMTYPFRERMNGSAARNGVLRVNYRITLLFNALNVLMFSDGDCIDLDWWHPNQPSSASQRCINIRYNAEGIDELFNDGTCSNELCFVCDCMYNLSANWCSANWNVLILMLAQYEMYGI